MAARVYIYIYFFFVTPFSCEGFICGVVLSHLLFGNHIVGMRELITLLIVFILLTHIALYPLCSMGCF